ncbi:hypothetical protein Mapa_011450 [Marchantia paleacea]|nr:hypothetical protein Mapa_011450 [Marchantia paleacea]
MRTSKIVDKLFSGALPLRRASVTSTRLEGRSQAGTQGLVFRVRMVSSFEDSLSAEERA